MEHYIVALHSFSVIFIGLLSMASSRFLSLYFCFGNEKCTNLYHDFSLEIPKSAYKWTSVTLALHLGGLGSDCDFP